VPDYSFALIHLALGEKDQAIHWLESSLAKHQPDLNWIRVDPDLRPLHGDPRFEGWPRKLFRRANSLVVIPQRNESRAPPDPELATASPPWRTGLNGS